MYTTDPRRIEELSKLITRCSDLIDLLEENDPQYKAVEKIAGMNGCSIAALVVIGNALVSYQLTSRGEVYWSRFGEYMSEKKYSSISEAYARHRSFLENTPYNRTGLKAKIKRLERYYHSRVAVDVFKDPLKYCSSLDKLAGKLSMIYNARRDSKTIVFAAKMYYYVCRACGVRDVGGNIAIPVDRRIAYLSLTSCLVRNCRKEVRNCVMDLISGRWREIVVDVWRNISLKTGIGSYRLDTLLWLLARFIREGNRDIESIVENVIKEYPVLKNKINCLRQIIAEFSKCR